MGGKLYFHYGQAHGRELWESDGTAAGTVEVVDLLPGTNGSLDDKPMIVFDNHLYFAGSTSLGNFEVFKSDGTAAGTALLHDIAPGAGSSHPGNWTIYNNELYFSASTTGANLWKTDGTTATQMTTGLNIGYPTVFKGELYFSGGNDLWKTDGTIAGTVMLKPMAINSGFMGANNDYLFSRYQAATAPPLF